MLISYNARARVRERKYFPALLSLLLTITITRAITHGPGAHVSRVYATIIILIVSPGIRDSRHFAATMSNYSSRARVLRRATTVFPPSTEYFPLDLPTDAITESIESTRLQGCKCSFSVRNAETNRAHESSKTSLSKRFLFA